MRAVRVAQISRNWLEGFVGYWTELAKRLCSLDEGLVCCLK